MNMVTRILQNLQYRKALIQIRKAGTWFVDIPHTSSSSIKVELYQCFGQAFGKGDMPDTPYNINNQPLPNHLTALEMRRRLKPEIWDGLFTFTVVRNPWDRMVSHFHYRKAVGEIAKNTGFQDYLKLFFRSPGASLESPFNYHGHYYQCADYLLDHEGSMMVDYVARYENREQDLRTLSSLCKCRLGRLHLNRSSSIKNYRSYYDEETRALVARISHKDIELFGYEF